VYTKQGSDDNVKFSWDEAKRKENWRVRKVDFAEAVGIFDEQEVIESIDDREDYREQRIQARRHQAHHHRMEGGRKWQTALRKRFRATISRH
jgi:hypothetical protein